MFPRIVLLSVPALVAAASAALVSGAKPTPPCAERKPECPIAFALDPEQAALLASDVVGPIELKLGASSSQGEVKVTVYLSHGLELLDGELVFVDQGAGETLLVEKTDRAPQWIQLWGSTQRDDGESFANHQLFGAEPTVVLEGSQVINGAVTLQAQWE